MQAINDAQSSLDSLLNPSDTGEPGQPVVLSASGRVRNQARGRVAGPAAPPSKALRATRAPLLFGEGEDEDETSLAIVPGTVPLYGPVREHSAQDTALGRSVALATGKLQTVRDRANLLVGAVDEVGIGPALVSSALPEDRRAAAQWVTRYATHIVILLVVGALVAFGGLKTLTAQGALPHSLGAAYSGTDHFDDDADFAQNGKASIDSQDFTLTLPRTELGGTDAASNSVVKSLIPDAVQPQPAGKKQPAPRAAQVVQYKVAVGDSIEAIAGKFNLLPETVMGSNGIYDSEEILAPGRVLNIPPIDGMYYVAKEGDTPASIAERFQVAPDALAGYAADAAANGQVVAGQAILVPGGMMPPREATVAYTVRQGDTLKRIAARFGVDVPTIINSNDIPNPDSLKIGTELRLLPLPGVEYKIKKGDTVLTIADKLGVSPQMILDYPPNHLAADTPLQVDALIMVPGGSPEQEVMAARVEPVSRSASPPERQPEAKVEPPKKAASTDNSKPASKVEPKPASKVEPKPAAKVEPKPVAKVEAPKPAPKPARKPAAKSDNAPKVGTGRLMWPVNGTITQYFSSYHNGLDIAIRAGTPLHAADSGRVVWSGWRTDGLGYCVMIDHLNGLTTVYGHMIRQPSVYVDQYVSRGQVIGYIGSTGHSTGPHVHFMVKVGSAASHVYRNPLSFLGR